MKNEKEISKNKIHHLHSSYLGVYNIPHSKIDLFSHDRGGVIKECP